MFLKFDLPSMPTAVFISLLVKPCSGTWHIPQDIVLFNDNLLSKNNFFPSSIFSLVIGLSLGMSSFGKPNCFIVTNFIKSALFPFLSLKLNEFVS